MISSYMRHVRGEKYNFIIDIIFTPFTWLSSTVISFMDFLRRHGILKTTEPSLPLISVGNITYGGTNKTPFVAMLAEYSKSRGINTGIVTRGYTGRTHSVIVIKDGKGTRTLTGDEPLMLSGKLNDVPVAVSRHRISGVEALKSSGVELVIADDAFQHKSLGRDCDIVLIDAVCPFGSGKLIPAGIMREKLHALKRADIIVITKSEQVKSSELNKIHDTLTKYVSPDKIFTSRLEHDGYILYGTDTAPVRGSKVLAFSAIGSPESFRRSITAMGLILIEHMNFTDHHQYTLNDLEKIYDRAKTINADFIICTEKDIYNLPENYSWPYDIPLAVPKVKAAVNESIKFFRALTEALKPKVIVASNGYGEDAIGVVLAEKLRERLRHSDIWAFPLVGRGDAYIRRGFAVKSAPSLTPSGGVIKYSLHDLWGDLRHGLIQHIKAQLNDWNKIAPKILTPVCAGDVYLLLHTLWGSGKRPLFCATAKTVYLSGHWRLERLIINSFTLRTWTRDQKSAEQLGGNAVYSGSPIMDLLPDNMNYTRGDVVLLLPGSRKRANSDVRILLDAVEVMYSEGERSFRMILAPTLKLDEFLRSCELYGWNVKDSALKKNDITITLTEEPAALSSNGGKILLGLGGTANQLCAGLGIPVISIDEKGKRVQKKLLGNAEILTEPNGYAMAMTAMKVLRDNELYEFMSSSGRERMGSKGAVDDIVKYMCEELGFDVRDRVYEEFRAD